MGARAKKKSAEIPTQKTLFGSDAHHQPGQTEPMISSDTNEWYTPRWVLDLVIKVLGEIDLDPCSNSREDPNVPATYHLTQEDDGLSKPWTGRVFMNPPYGDVIEAWVDKLISEYEKENVSEAIALTGARTDTAWFKKLLNYPFPCCLVDGRIKFSNAKNSSTIGSAIFYLGPDVLKFSNVFKEIGTIVTAMAMKNPPKHARL
jgi:hypothetical protein